MTAPTFFTVTGDYLPSTDKGNIWGTLEFTMLIASGDTLAIPSLDTIIVPVVTQASLSKGVLVDATGNPGVELLANAAAVGLSGALYYQVTFNQVWYQAPGEAPVEMPLNSFTFQAPTTGTTVDLSTVTPAAGVVAAQVASVVSANITDATTIGRELLTATNSTAALTLLGGVKSYGNTFLVGDFGAKVDGKTAPGTISSSSLNTVSCTGYQFTAADVGKTIIIGGGASSTSYQAHVTTIASVSGNNAILTTPASNAVTLVATTWGTDDGAAWQSAFTAAVNTYGAQLIMPAGISVCGQAISLAPSSTTKVGFSLRGASMGSSRIVSTASGGFLTLNLTGALFAGVGSQVDVSNLTVTTTVAGATTAITAKGTLGGVTQQINFRAEKVLCSGFDNISGYFATAIAATGLYNTYFEDVWLVGVWPAPNTNYTDTSPWFLATLGIDVSESWAPTFQNIYISNFARAVQAISTISNLPQGTVIQNGWVLNCREGYYWEGPGLPPQVQILGGFYNCRDFNICINGWKYGMISNGLSYMLDASWAPSSTLATAVNTSTTPTTLTLASTSGFPEVGAVLIGSEWFTYNNLVTGASTPFTGMNGTTLNNVTRAQFGTVDPGSNYSTGTTVAAATADVVLLNTYTIRVDNEQFAFPTNPNRINVLLHSGNNQGSVEDSHHFTSSYAVAVGKDSVSTDLLNNTHASGMTQVLDGASDTVYKSRRARSCRLIKTATQSVPTGTSPTTLTWDSADWDTEGFWTGSAITIPKNKGIKRVRITANVVFSANAIGSRMIEISYNGIYAESGDPFRSQSVSDLRIFGETPSGSINGTNTVFTLANSYTSGTTAVYRNGLRAVLGYDYTESAANQITFTTAPASVDLIAVDYSPLPAFLSGIGTTCELNVVGGDVIRVAVAQDSGSSLNAGAGTQSQTFVICEVIEGA